MIGSAGRLAGGSAGRAERWYDCFRTTAPGKATSPAFGFSWPLRHSRKVKWSPRSARCAMSGVSDAEGARRAESRRATAVRLAGVRRTGCRLESSPIQRWATGRSKESHASLSSTPSDDGKRRNRADTGRLPTSRPGVGCGGVRGVRCGVGAGKLEAGDLGEYYLFGEYYRSLGPTAPWEIASIDPIRWANAGASNSVSGSWRNRSRPVREECGCRSYSVAVVVSEHCIG